MVNIVSRSQWGATPWDGQPYSAPLSVRHYFVVHYHGGAVAHQTGNAVPRNIEKIHLDNGWSGIGYNFAVDQDGVAYEGRGWNLVGAHCPGRNRDGIGVYVAVGGDQEPSEAAKRTVRALYAEACRKTGEKLHLGWHGKYYATACAGPKLIPWVKAGMPVSGTSIPAPKANTQPSPSSKKKKVNAVGGWSKAPDFPLKKGWYFGPKSGPASSVSGYYGHRSDLKRWQQRMKDRGWDITPDGLYGPVTAGVARGIQRQCGLSVDGLVGIRTWNAAWVAEIT